MNCPFCKAKRAELIDSRQLAFYRRRRYLCHNCGRRFTTHEKVWRNPKEDFRNDFSSESTR